MELAACDRDCSASTSSSHRRHGASLFAERPRLRGPIRRCPRVGGTTLLRQQRLPRAARTHEACPRAHRRGRSSSRRGPGPARSKPLITKQRYLPEPLGPSTATTSPRDLQRRRAAAHARGRESRVTWNLVPVEADHLTPRPRGPSSHPIVRVVTLQVDLHGNAGAPWMLPRSDPGAESPMDLQAGRRREETRRPGAGHRRKRGSWAPKVSRRTRAPASGPQRPLQAAT